VATATNTADGKIVFDKIVVTAAGTYTFTVMEETGTLENVTYDKTQYVVVIEVTDNTETGKLEVSTPVIKKVGDDNAVAEIVFENTYVVPPMPDNPQTGDNTRITLWVTIMFISAVGLVGTMLYEASAKRAMKANEADEEA
jgi:pilin isopeptide linkage protein